MPSNYTIAKEVKKVAYYREICETCGAEDLGDAFRGPLDCDVPVLFVSGDLDARTPPSNADHVRQGFTDHAHVVVRNVGHPARENLSAEYRALLRRFLEGEPVESCTLELPPIRFFPIEG